MKEGWGEEEVGLSRVSLLTILHVTQQPGQAFGSWYIGDIEAVCS
jgi:hypothetical protein